MPAQGLRIELDAGLVLSRAKQLVFGLGKVAGLLRAWNLLAEGCRWCFQYRGCLHRCR